MGKKRKRSNKKRLDLKGAVIKRQYDEISRLKDEIEKLNIDSKEKENLVSSIESLKDEFEDVIEEIKKKSIEYDKLIDELIMMRNAFNKEVFKGRWKIVKWLLK